MSNIKDTVKHCQNPRVLAYANFWSI